MSASASVTPPNPTATIDALRQQIAALEKRVTELEKPNADDLKDDSEQEAATKKLEQRLANLETRSGDGSDTPLTVTAPFIVVDRKGKPIMWVGEAGEKEGEGGFSRGMYIHNAAGFSVAHVGALAEGTGRIYVASTASGPAVGMYMSDKGGRIFMRHEGHTVFAVDKQSLTLYNSAELATVALQTAEQSKVGRLILFDASGKVMVQAGTTDKQVGAVFAGPNGNGVAGTLTGGKAASQITGRAD